MKYPISEHDGKEYKIAYGFYFHKDTNDEVIDRLAKAYSMQSRIRIYYGNTKTGHCWMDEYNMQGTIGRSTGQIKIPLMIANSRSTYGPGILEHCIIGIQFKNQWLYKHEKFNMPEMTIAKSDMSEYAEMVLFDGEIQARFKKIGQAERYVEFMQGKRMSK